LAGANSALPDESDDFAFIGGLRDTPVEMVKCETVDVDVPANAEIIVEGEFKPFNWTTQGQFASFNGFYDVPRRRPVFDVTAITMRKNPIYQHVHIGRPLNECNSIAAFFRSVRTFVQIKEIMPNGYFRVEGKRVIEINQDKQEMKLTGIVRPRDIRADNTVLSYNIAEANIKYSGKGTIHNAQRVGFVRRIINWIL
ncbi:MAG: UbiD family decarboxylase, partial [Candidatus Marinimicrobia bacterium]|nr:UbiD family decarboxylase [Candidatus Neomarinimicrobiota bacterium]